MVAGSEIEIVNCIALQGAPAPLVSATAMRRQRPGALAALFLVQRFIRVQIDMQCGILNRYNIEDAILNCHQ